MNKINQDKITPQILDKIKEANDEAIYVIQFKHKENGKWGDVPIPDKFFGYRKYEHALFLMKTYQRDFNYDFQIVKRVTNKEDIIIKD